MNFHITESQRPANKRRKRKGSNSGNAGGPQITQSGVGGSTSGPTASSKKRSPGPSGGGGAGFNLASQVGDKQTFMINYYYIHNYYKYAINIFCIF